MIIARGRFGALLAHAAANNGLSLKEVADRAGVSYEQIRKLALMHSHPSPLLLKELCRILSLDPSKAEDAVAADRMDRKYGAAGLRVRKLSPRVARLEELVGLLTDEQFEAALAMIRGLVQSGRKQK